MPMRLRLIICGLTWSGSCAMDFRHPGRATDRGRWDCRRVKPGLLQPQAAQEIGITRYRLTCWLHQKDTKYTEWIAQLRVEEAKRVIKEQPGLSNDAIAQHCGFSDRTAFQKKFKKHTGMTPLQYAEHL